MDEIKANIKQAAKAGAMNLKRMSVILWCVTAIILIVWLNLFYGNGSEENNILPHYVNVTALTLIAALGGADVWKNRTKPGM